MERVNGANHVDIGGGRRGFRSQNALLGIPGTEVTEVWLNGVQEELLAVIEDAGLEPDHEDNTQLLQALLRVATGRVLMIDVTERASDQPASGEADGIVRTVTPNRGSNGRFYLAAIEHGSRDPGGVQTGSQIKLKRSIGAGAVTTLSTKRLNHYTATSGQDVIGTSVIFAYDPVDAGGDSVTVRVSHQPLGSGEASTFYAGSTLAILEIGYE